MSSFVMLQKSLKTLMPILQYQPVVGAKENHIRGIFGNMQIRTYRIKNTNFIIMDINSTKTIATYSERMRQIEIGEETTGLLSVLGLLHDALDRYENLNESLYGENEAERLYLPACNAFKPAFCFIESRIKKRVNDNLSNIFDTTSAKHI